MREVADLKPLGAHHLPGLRRQATGDELREGRFAVAVRAEERDAIVAVDAQGEPPQHGLARGVARRNAVERDDRRGEILVRRGNLDRPRLVLQRRRLRLELGEQLEPGLRLARFRRLGAEAIDERHDAAPLRLAFFGKLGIERLALLALALEGRIAAAIECEPPALEMQDVIDRLIE